MKVLRNGVALVGPERLARDQITNTTLDVWLCLVSPSLHINPKKSVQRLSLFRNIERDKVAQTFLKFVQKSEKMSK